MKTFEMVYLLYPTTKVQANWILNVTKDLFPCDWSMVNDITMTIDVEVEIPNEVLENCWHGCCILLRFKSEIIYPSDNLSVKGHYTYEC